MGNFNLLFEFMDFYELISIFIFGEVIVNFGVYYCLIMEVIECIFIFENNVNIMWFFNIGENCIMGLELNVKYSLSRKFFFLVDFNYGYFICEGSFEDFSFDFDVD